MGKRRHHTPLSTGFEQNDSSVWPVLFGVAPSVDVEEELDDASLVEGGTDTVTGLNTPGTRNDRSDGLALADRLGAPGWIDGAPPAWVLSTSTSSSLPPTCFEGCSCFPPLVVPCSFPPLVVPSEDCFPPLAVPCSFPPVVPSDCFPPLPSALFLFSSSGSPPIFSVRSMKMWDNRDRPLVSCAKNNYFGSIDIRSSSFRCICMIPNDNSSIGFIEKNGTWVA